MKNENENRNPKSLTSDSKASHDVNSHLSALTLALKMIKEDWETNPQSVEKVIELSIEKLQKLSEMLKSNHR